MASKVIDQNLVRHLFDYNGDTGNLVRKVGVSNQPAGTIVGYRQISNGREYRALKIFRQPYHLHRVVWLWMMGDFPKHEIDHINGDATDNRWSNLRHVTHQENCRNLPILRTNKTGICGVTWHYRDSAWVSAIRVDGRKSQLYHGQDFFEACCRRKSAEAVHGFHANHGRLK